MQFTFASAHNIFFGAGSVARAGTEAARIGRHALLITGRGAERAAVLNRSLSAAGLARVSFSVTGEPAIEQVVEGAALARREKCDLIIGMGGGSVLDAAKAVAALATNTDPIENYLEVIGRGQPLRHNPLPCIAIPTTAGTGSEVTRNAVLKSTRHRVKVSLRSPRMLPVLAIVDPELSLSLPPAITAATGGDALTQLLESFVSVKANPLTDALCREALPRAAKALPQVVAHGADLHARSDMALASLFSGLTLANAGLGAVHGIAGPLGGMIEAPHGALCTRLLPYVVEANVNALQLRMPHSEALDRYRQAARMLTGSDRAEAVDGIHWLHELATQLGIPDLAHWGLTTTGAVADLVAMAQKASSMKGNPIRLEDREVKDLILRALGTPQGF